MARASRELNGMELTDESILLRQYREADAELLYEAVREGVMRKRLLIRGKFAERGRYIG